MYCEWAGTCWCHTDTMCIVNGHHCRRHNTGCHEACLMSPERRAWLDVQPNHARTILIWAAVIVVVLALLGFPMPAGVGLGS